MRAAGALAPAGWCRRPLPKTPHCPPTILLGLLRLGCCQDNQLAPGSGGAGRHEGLSPCLHKCGLHSCCRCSSCSLDWQAGARGRWGAIGEALGGGGRPATLDEARMGSWAPAACSRPHRIHCVNTAVARSVMLAASSHALERQPTLAPPGALADALQRSQHSSSTASMLLHCAASGPELVGLRRRPAGGESGPSGDEPSALLPALRAGNRTRPCVTAAFRRRGAMWSMTRCSKHVAPLAGQPSPSYDARAAVAVPATAAAAPCWTGWCPEQVAPCLLASFWRHASSDSSWNMSA